jgi:hypothetical protein
MGGMANPSASMRPTHGGPAASSLQPQTQPAQPAAPAAPSALRPPTLSGPAMDIRPTQHQAADPQPHAASPQPIPTPHHIATPAPAQVQHRPMQPPVHAAQQSAQTRAATSFLTPPTQAAQPGAVPQPRTTPAQPTAVPQQHASGAFRPDDEAPGKGHKTPHPTAHSGLIGFAAFLVFGALFLAPLLPGKIWETAPGSSQSFSTGNQTIGCISELTNAKTSLSYDTKIGFPLTYDYATTSTMTADCNGKPGHAIGGHTGQFNPLGLLADTALAITIAVIAAKLWRRFKSPE